MGLARVVANVLVGAPRPLSQDLKPISSNSHFARTGSDCGQKLLSYPRRQVPLGWHVQLERSNTNCHGVSSREMSVDHLKQLMSAEKCCGRFESVSIRTEPSNGITIRGPRRDVLSSSMGSVAMLSADEAELVAITEELKKLQELLLWYSTSGACFRTC